MPLLAKNDINTKHLKHQLVVLKLFKKENTHLWVIDLTTFKHKPHFGILSTDERKILS